MRISLPLALDTDLYQLIQQAFGGFDAHRVDAQHIGVIAVVHTEIADIETACAVPAVVAGNKCLGAGNGIQLIDNHQLIGVACGYIVLVDGIVSGAITEPDINLFAIGTQLKDPGF